MGVIYEPSGKAREYSPLACNLYLGCNHGCRYCYMPGVLRKSREQCLIPIERGGIVRSFGKEAEARFGSDVPILFCFMSDPYNEAEAERRVTRRCLEIANRCKLKIKILTKSKLVLRDMDLFREFGERIRVGMTLTFFDEKKSREWEPGASSPDERIETLRELKKNGVKTWASFEPVIEPEESLAMMRAGVEIIDFWKIGKLNNFQGLDKGVDWSSFLERALAICRRHGEIYVKKDLREAASRVKLEEKETVMK
jgi:DNA repair photolyase